MQPNHILLVEDEYISALYLQKKLETLGYKVSGPVTSGEEAIEQARNTKPDLILMDIHLAGKIDGIEAARKIITDQPTRIIFMTGYSDKNMKERATSLNPEGYLTKPIQPQQIVCVLDQAFSRHE